MSKTKEDKVIRSRNWTCTLYPESQQSVIDLIPTFTEHYAYIIHDRDTDENGILKKAHCHVILHFDCPRTAGGLAKQMSILPNALSPVKDNRAMFRYLIHLDNEDKARYNAYDIECNGFYYDCKNAFLKDPEKKSVDSSMKEFYLWLHSFNRYVPVHECLLWAIETSNVSFLRSCYKIVVDEVYYHNDFVRSIEKEGVDL